VSVNTRGRYGAVERTVTVFTSHGAQTLTIRVKIPVTPAPYNVPPRQMDVLAAKADRQAVFRGHCAACHTWPAAQQMGENLFQKACGICHIDQYRADFVPDLAALKHPTDANFWRVWIVRGKPGTLMPAFAISEGGILDTNQVESLVDYLVKNYPSRVLARPESDPSDYLLQPPK
jgi:mono/diheme cytochrome c family protein